MKTPCEIIVWSVVPIIRKEFAKNLIENHGFIQRKAAEKLGITEATVSLKNLLNEYLRRMGLLLLKKHVGFVGF